MAHTGFPESKERSRRYGRVISAFVLGSFFLVSGLIGLKPDQAVVHAPAGQPVISRVTERPRWEDPSILSQVALGIGLVVLGVFWYHRVGDPRVNVFRPGIKNVGAGKSRGALKLERNRLENGPRQ